MEKTDILKNKLQVMFPDIYNDVHKWQFNAKNEATLIMNNRRILVFTYESTNSWSLESIKHYAQVRS